MAVWPAVVMAARVATVAVMPAVAVAAVAVAAVAVAAVAVAAVAVAAVAVAAVAVAAVAVAAVAAQWADIAALPVVAERNVKAVARSRLRAAAGSMRTVQRSQKPPCRMGCSPPVHGSGSRRQTEQRAVRRQQTVLTEVLHLQRVRAVLRQQRGLTAALRLRMVPMAAQTVLTEVLHPQRVLRAVRRQQRGLTAALRLQMVLRVAQQLRMAQWNAAVRQLPPAGAALSWHPAPSLRRARLRSCPWRCVHGRLHLPG